MTATLARLDPRRTGTKAAPVRTAEHIRADLAASEQEAQDAIAEGLRLTGQTKAILLAGDDAAHERHEADIARLRRIVARCEARQEDLCVEMRMVEARTAESIRDRQRTDAQAAVSAVVAKASERYSKPAALIAAFMADWIEADRMAREAGVPGPDVAAGRVQPSSVKPGRVEEVAAYLDEYGRRTLNPHPYKPDGSLDRSKTREARTFVDTAPDTIEPGRRLPALADLVNLPHITEHGEHHRAERPTSNGWR